MPSSSKAIGIAVAGLLILGAVTGGKAQQAPANDQAARLEAGTVDVRASRVYVLVNKSGLGHDHGMVGLIKSGAIRLDRATNLGSLEFDLKSFRADPPEARKAVGLAGETDQATQKEVTANMVGPSVLDTAHYDTAKFVIKSSTPLETAQGKSRVRLAGSLMLHGVSKPLDLECDVTPVAGGHRLRTRFKLRQTDFGITPFTKALGVVGVANELTIWGDVYVAGQGT